MGPGRNERRLLIQGNQARWKGEGILHTGREGDGSDETQVEASRQDDSHTGGKPDETDGRPD